MKKIICLAMLAFFLAGCEIAITPRDKLPEIEVYKGKEGLSVMFVPGTPPEKIIATTTPHTYEVGVIAENKGAADAKGVVALILEKNFMEATEKYKELGEAVAGKERFISGGVKDLTFEIKTKGLNKENYEENPKINIQAAACYEYQTKFSGAVCIDTSFYRGRAEAGVCRESTVTFAEGQGAPVAITKIEPLLLVAGSEALPYFKIFVKNVGEGEILNKAQISDACSEKPAVHNIIHLETATIGGKQLICEPKEETDEKAWLKMTEGNDANYFTCKLAEGTGFDAAAPSFTTELSVVLSYGYETTISKQVEITVI